MVIVLHIIVASPKRLLFCTSTQQDCTAHPTLRTEEKRKVLGKGVMLSGGLLWWARGRANETAHLRFLEENIRARSIFGGESAIELLFPGLWGQQYSHEKHGVQDGTASF